MSLRLVFIFLAVFVEAASGALYFIAPSGSNANPGTQALPFATLQKGHDVANAGDTIFMRGGTYSYPTKTIITRDGTSGNHIKIFNFTGETPVIDAINQPGGVSRTGVIEMVGANWWHIKGLEVKNGPNQGIITYEGSSNNIFERLNIHHTGRLAINGQGNGLKIWGRFGGGCNNLVLNNDIHENEDRAPTGNPDPGGGANGIDIGDVQDCAGNVVRGNRVWCNSDDGIDFWNSTPGLIENNWVWEAGRGIECRTTGGDGHGLKLGGGGPNDGRHTVRFNATWDNKTDGFNENAGDKPMLIYNNTIWRNNRSCFFFQSLTGTGAHQFRNNICYDAVGVMSGGPSVTFNSWTLPVTVTDADFISLDEGCVKNSPRQADGSLPVCNFLKLAPGSDLINKGTNVGLPFNGSAPDLGAFETGAVQAPTDFVDPTVALTAPASGATVSGTAVTVSATASDNTGVAGVQFKLDGTTNLGAEDTTSPYSVPWNSTTSTNGLHTINAVARDTAGNTAVSAPITFTVTNAVNTFVESEIASGFTSITAMAFAPDGRLFIVQQGGQVRVIQGGAVLPTPVITLSPATGGERGLLGIAIDPSFASNGFIYLYYTASTPATHNRVSRFTVVSNIASPASESVVVDLDNLGAATNHNGGGLLFGNDGKLYIAQGDNAVSSNSQSLSNRFGKIMRVNSNGTIPSDNPFIGNTTGANQAIWAIGLRNPFTFASDPQTGVAGTVININDVGENTWEEINRAVAGVSQNYAWPTCEGPQNTGVGTCTDTAFKYPIHAYNHSVGSAVTGGAFYRAGQFPASYQGAYFFGDYTADFIKYLADGTNAVSDFRSADSPVDIDVGPVDGAIYYASIVSGKIFKIAWTGADNTPPSVSITAPANGATVSGSITVSAGATDAGTVDGVQFKLDGANLGAEDTTFSYFTSWDTTTASNGSHVLTAVARDALGNSATSASISVTVNNTASTSCTQTALNLASAVSDGGFSYQVIGSFGTPASNVNNFTISTLRLFENTLELGPANALHADIRNLGLGRFSHWVSTDETIRFSASNNTDPRSNGKTYCYQISSDTTPPTVSLTAPASGAIVATTVTVSATASDNVGVSGVQFLLDGANLGAEDLTTPYSIAWNTSFASNGPHVLGAVARDTTGITGTAASRNVTVNNADICP